MRSISTLAILLLGLAVVFWAPAAKADCPHNDDDTHQHCGGGASTSNEFRFVGFSTTPIMPAPNVGFPGMHEVCQDDFADPGARMCTKTEYVLSPTAVLPSSESWIRDPARVNCSDWSQTGGSGLVARPDGTFATITSNCAESKLVTCCAPIQ